MNLKIKNTWSYVGDDRWDWEVYLDDNGSGELAQVKFVEYILHPTFLNPVRNVKDPQNGFRLKSNGWGTFDVKAFIHKENGEKEKVIHHLKLEYDPESGTSD
ncbi:MAG: hypothetical protein D8M58_21345 [Calditrichaeota bacterium]|nr:MAG: hypothetical protein DWQ03_00070 [Calditrichota bacterium]MBL1207959.1 hypothetical protein [Calditrichota bacterium]NOG47795.1 hypothetical protein [Calditrichota bacterium]